MDATILSPKLPIPVQGSDILQNSLIYCTTVVCYFKVCYVYNHHTKYFGSLKANPNLGTSVPNLWQQLQQSWKISGAQLPTCAEALLGSWPGVSPRLAVTEEGGWTWGRASHSPSTDDSMMVAEIGLLQDAPERKLHQQIPAHWADKRHDRHFGKHYGSLSASASLTGYGGSYDCVTSVQ